MSTDTSADDALAPRLPLPLAQLYRRAANAKTPLARHLTAINLWEAALKLLAAAVLVEYARRPDPDPKLAARLQSLARPALGHWWEFVRLLLPVLAERGDPDFGRLRDLVLGRARDDFPRAAGLDGLLREVLQGERGGRATVRFTELIERLVMHRNKGPGHGAPAQQPDAHHDRLARALLAAAAEVLDRLDMLAGRRLLHVAEVSQSGGLWLVQRYELLGESARRLAALELPREEAASVPDGDRLYLAATEAGDRPAEWRLLHPLLWYDAEAGEVLFLNSRRGKRQTEYLSYASGRTLERPDQGREQRLLLARALGMEVAAADVEAWATRSQAEEAPAPEAPAAGGRMLGEFELLSKLGEGGMGVVYRAWQPSLQRQVALKELRPGGDARTLARFRREIKALGRVEHPHLVKVFTSGSDGERWFYAMELVEGAPLSAVCDRLQQSKTSAAEVDAQTWQEAVSTACSAARQAEKPLSTEQAGPPAAAPAEQPVPALGTGRTFVRQAAELMRQVAEAAHALHEAGVLHRDVKPGNILVTADGTQAVLMDLGLAQIADDEQGRLTRTRQFVGTLRYASPEQLAGATLDRRADVYSLGATLWELLALRPLFGVTEQTPTPDLMLKVQQAEPERLRRVHPRLNRDLEAIAHRCLEKDPRKRYATAREVAEDLGRFLEGRPVRARHVSGLERGLKWAKRRPALAALAAVFLVGTAALLVGWAWFTVQLDEARRQAEGLADLEAQHARDAVQKSREAEQARRNEEAQRKLAQKAERSERTQRGLAEMARLDAERSADDSRRQLGQTLAGRGLQVWAEGKGGEALLHLAAALQADHDDAARARAHQGRLAAFWGSYPRLLKLWPYQPKILSAAFSPDGAKVVTCHADDTVQLWDVETGRPLLEPPLRHKSVGRARLSGDGKRLLTVPNAPPRAAGKQQQPAEVRVWDLATRKGAVLTVPGPVDFLEAVCNQDASRVLVRSGTFPLGEGEEASVRTRLWSAKTGKPEDLDWGKGGLEHAAFSPDGRRLLTLTTSGEARVWDALTGARVAHLGKQRLPLCSLGFSGDGRRCLIVTASEVTVWDAATGQKVGRVVGGGPGDDKIKPGPPDAAPPEVFGGGWLNHDGSLVAVSVQGQVEVRNVRIGLVVGPVVPHAGSVEACHFRPDGSGVVSLTDLSQAESAPPFLGGPPLPGGGFLGQGPSAQALAGYGGLGGPAGLGGHTRTPTFGGSLLGGGFTGAGAPPRPTGTGDVRTWSLAPGLPTGVADKITLLPLNGFASVAAVSPDGRLLLAAGWRDALLWDLTANRMAAPPLGLQGEILAAWLSPTGRHLLVLTSRELRLWSLEARNDSGLALPDAGRVLGAQFSPDGRRILTAVWPDPNRPLLPGAPADTLVQVQLWDARTGQPLTGPRTYPQFIKFYFSGDGPRVLTGKQKLRAWDPLGGRLVGETAASADLLGVAFHDGRRLVTRTVGNSVVKTVQAWDVENDWKPLMRLDLQGQSVQRAEVYARGRLLVTSSRRAQESEVRVWDLETGRPVGRPVRVSGSVEGAAVSGDGERLLVVQGPSSSPPFAGIASSAEWQLWDLKRGRAVTNPQACTLPWAPLGDRWLEWFRPDGRQFLTVHGEEITLRDAATGNELPVKRLKHGGPVRRVRYSADGRRLVSVCFLMDETRPESPGLVRVWATDTGEPLIPPMIGDDIELTADGERMVVLDHPPQPFAMKRPARAYQLNPAMPLAPPLDAEFAAFSPDGSRLLVADGAEVRVLDLLADRHRPAEWGDLVQLLSGQALDRTGTAVPLDAEAAGRLWQRLRKAHPEHFTVSAAERLAWHHREALRAEAASDWYGAAWHLDRLMPAVPPEGSLYLARGLAHFNRGPDARASADLTRAAELNPEDWRPPFVLGDLAVRQERWADAVRLYVSALGKEAAPLRLFRERAVAFLRRGQWQPAAALYDRLRRGVSPDVSDWVNFALLRLQLGDVNGYRKACADLLARRGTAGFSDNRAAIGMVWACALAPDAGVAPGELVNLATTANTPSARTYWSLKALALALYRAGDHARAVETLNDAIKVHGRGGLAHDWLILAMAHHRLGHADQAGQWLKKAVGALDSSPHLDWPDSVALPLLRREAEALMAGRDRKGK
jgi:serine/threonine protein kinase/WD40 repeat protein/tetratricopeptide (TPR) repeat protein